MENNIIELKPFIKMGVEKLREELHLLIDSTDEKYLKAIHTLMVRNLQEEETDWYDELSDERKADIELGLQQAKEGKMIPHEQVMAEARKFVKNRNTK
jgi:predicted transcriptional regulator